MKKNKIQVLLFVLFSIGLSACSNDDIYDFPGTSENLVYVKSSTNTVNSFDLAKFKVYHTPVGSQSDLNVKFPVFAIMKATKSISAQVSIDNSLVDAYNSEHSTEYKKVPENVVVFENGTLTIPAGDMISKDSVSVSLNGNNLKSLEVGNYIIPITLKTVEGAKPSSNRNRIFLLVNVDEDSDNIWDNGVSSGNLLTTNRSTWTLEFAPNYSASGGEMSKVFDGIVGSNWNDSWYCNLKQNTTVIIDMKSEQANVAGLYIKDMLSNSNFSYSNDKQNWTNLGKVSGTRSQIVFYSPISARYIKWEIPVKTSSWGTYISLFEISIYQK